MVMASIQLNSESHSLTYDWEVLRKRSLVPGGFGSERVQIWCVLVVSLTHRANGESRPQLLGVSPLQTSTSTHSQSSDNLISVSEAEDKKTNGGVPPVPPLESELEPHRDEHQIRLDTDRSFVLYPASLSVPISR
jgi:TBC1 domain family member 20